MHHEVFNFTDKTFSNGTVPDSDTMQMLCLFVQMGVQNPEPLVDVWSSHRQPLRRLAKNDKPKANI